MSRTFEYIAVGAVVVLMAAISIFAVHIARSQTRDVTRLSQVRELQMALELYYQGNGTYPISEEPLALGQALTACLSHDGFSEPCSPSGETPYLEIVATPVSQGLHGKVTCGDISNVYCYQGSPDAYQISFELERGNAILGVAKGANCLSGDGFSAGACAGLGL